MSQFVATTPLKDMRPLGTQAERSLPRLQAMLDREFHGQIGFKLGEPVVRKDGAGVDWYTDSDEPLTQMTSLAPELVDYYRKRLMTDVGRVKAAADAFDTRGDAGSRTTALALRNTITYPGDDNVWIAGDVTTGEVTFIITGWGYEPYKSDAGVPQIGKKVWLPPKVSDKPAFIPLAGGGAGVLDAPTVNRSSLWYSLLSWLLWLLILALVMAIAWLLIPACGLRLPFGGAILYGKGDGAYCRQTANLDLQNDIRLAQAQREVIRVKEAALRQHIATCPPPAATPEPDPPTPRNLVKEALERNGITPDETGASVTLLWDNKNDLDLFLVCPDGIAKAGIGTHACGGRARLDQNFPPQPLLDNPVEHISAGRGDLQPGHYRVDVRNYRSTIRPLRQSRTTNSLFKRERSTLNTRERSPRRKPRRCDGVRCSMKSASHGIEDGRTNKC